jgi:hypothetical protein
MYVQNLGEFWGPWDQMYVQNLGNFIGWTEVYVKIWGNSEGHHWLVDWLPQPKNMVRTKKYSTLAGIKHSINRWANLLDATVSLQNPLCLLPLQERDLGALVRKSCLCEVHHTINAV